MATLRSSQRFPAKLTAWLGRCHSLGIRAPQHIQSLLEMSVFSSLHLSRMKIVCLSVCLCGECEVIYKYASVCKGTPENTSRYVQRGQRTPSDISYLRDNCPLLETESLVGTCGSPIRQNCLVSKLQGYSYLCSPRTGITSMCYHAQLLHGC